MTFTNKEIVEILNQLKHNNYVFSNYTNYDKKKKNVILRHDVDISIEEAYKMAKLEYTLDVTSTYFILIRGDFYNPFNKRNVELIKEMKGMGHQIGLHFDETLYPEDANLPKLIEKEIDVMRSLLGIEINSVSMHIPSRRTLESNYVISDGAIVNSYGDEFFKHFKYVSDSKMNWREDVYEVIQSGKYSNIHLLTHPVWYNINEYSMWDNVTKVMYSNLHNMYEDFSVHTDGVKNSKTISECIGALYDKYR